MAAPLHIIAGFLGAGKTTLMNRLLGSLEADTRAALIVNDFGEIPLDGTLIDRGDYALKELASGCVCCTLKGPLLQTLEHLAEDQSPDLILMETTGVAEPAEIAVSIRTERLSRLVTLGNVVCMVDAGSFLRYEKGLVVLGKQVTQANTIVLNKTDLVNGDGLTALRDRVEYLRTPDAVVTEARQADVDAGTVLEVRPVALPHTHHHHHHDETFVSLSVESDRPVNRKGLDAFLGQLATLDPDLLRAKGIVKTPEGTKLVQWTPSGCEVTDWTGEAETSRFVCIGTGPRPDALEAGFRECLE